jgi:hypothetical protein
MRVGYRWTGRVPCRVRDRCGGLRRGSVRGLLFKPLPPCVPSCFLVVFVSLSVLPAVVEADAAAPVPLAQRPEVQAALAYLRAEEPRTLEEQIRICEIPAPPFEEARRAEYFRQKFVAAGLRDVRIDAEGNVIGVRPGRTLAPTLVFSAHLDTVFPAGTDTMVKREGTWLKAPGIADDCRGLAVMLAVLGALNEKASWPPRAPWSLSARWGRRDWATCEACGICSRRR